MTTFSGFHICGADFDNATNTPRSATKALNEPLNLTEVLDGVDSDIPAYCNGSNSWIKFKASQIVPNCRAPDFMLKSSKIWLWGHTEYEFLPRGVPARLEFPVMRTPLRVTSSSFWPCTIAIVNLNTVPASFLNGGGTRGPYPRSDVVTYYDVQDALSEVWSDCVYGIERKVGWAATGELAWRFHV
ncbi:hypothetical protein HO173_012992 [Letharia columbiana]|uniref:Uncharacterized protein n=1 Tax=Letharia columbiana TaxID=112416 RepID=A0A8H6CK16_9LECA|nr:uncharacterized protein HO173_012992 [Letharia columbiana]KAF6224649.1 hypothetical protein HO173_012992 [Letharia columbiana]